MEPLSHMSASQLAMFCRCGEQYRRRYIENEIVPPNVALIRGKSVHIARDTNLSQKVTSGENLPLDAVVEAGRDAVVAEFTGEVRLDDEENGEPLTAEAAKGHTIDQVARLTACDYVVHQVGIQPVLVEKRITVEVPGLGRDIVGILDVADVNGMVRDLKTKTRTPPQRDADTSDQLTTYALLYQAEQGAPAAGVQLDFVVDLKGGPKAGSLLSSRTPAQLDALLARYFTAIQAIDRGDFVPCPSDFWACDGKWCGYFGTCKYTRR